MVRVFDLLEKRTKIPFDNREIKWNDAWLEEIMNQPTEKTVFYIGTARLISNKIYDKPEFLDKYHLSSVFSLGLVLVGTSMPLFLYEFTEEMKAHSRFSLFKGETYPRRYIRNTNAISGMVSLPDQYNEDWITYVRVIEDWINEMVFPSKSDKWEFMSIKANRVDQQHMMPEYYTSKNVLIRKGLSENADRVVHLSDVAEVLFPRRIREEEKVERVMRGIDLKNPLEVAKLEPGRKTNVELKNNDILLLALENNIRTSLFKYSGEENVYPSETLIVVRPKEQIAPEYLYLYLSAETSKDIMRSMQQGVVFKRLSHRDIIEFPVVLPSLENQKYIEAYNRLTSLDIVYSHTDLEDRLKSYNELLDKIEEEKNEKTSLEDILDIELAEKLISQHQERLQAFLEADIKELKACYNAKAYKATLILAGSILEAVLIDWLSDIRHENYFETDYYVIGSNGMTKKADLYDYINEIREIKRPDWMEEADKAHKIRRKRNLVHAKLCLNSSEELNDDTCKMVIGYLKEVIQTRIDSFGLT